MREGVGSGKGVREEEGQGDGMGGKVGSGRRGHEI